MFKGIARIGAMAALMASAACAPVDTTWSSSPSLSPYSGTGLILNALTSNGVGLAAAAVGFSVNSVALPDGALASR